MEERSWNGVSLLTVREAARVLRCSPQTVYRAIKEGRVSAFRLREHGALRVPAFELEHLVKPELVRTVEQATAATAGELAR